MEKDRLINYFKGMEANFRRVKTLFLASLVFNCFVIGAAYYYTLVKDAAREDRIYLVSTEGYSLTATAASGVDLTDIELRDHISRFHDLMFTLAPANEAIESSLEKALNYADKSAMDYIQATRESGFYRRLVSEDISQQFECDSIVFLNNRQPWRAKIYGKVYQLRPSAMGIYHYVGECQVVKVGRSVVNPHGMRIENFNVSEISLIEKKVRR